MFIIQSDMSVILPATYGGDANDDSSAAPPGEAAGSKSRAPRGDYSSFLKIKFEDMQLTPQELQTAQNNNFFKDWEKKTGHVEFVTKIVFNHLYKGENVRDILKTKYPNAFSDTKEMAKLTNAVWRWAKLKFKDDAVVEPPPPPSEPAAIPAQQRAFSEPPQEDVPLPIDSVLLKSICELLTTIFKSDNDGVQKLYHQIFRLETSAARKARRLEISEYVMEHVNGETNVEMLEKLRTALATWAGPELKKK